MFDWVGKRTSGMSAVGLLPDALQGIDIREMLAGATLMDEANRTTVDMLVLPYKDSLLLFSSYIQQLRDGVHNFFATFIEVLRDSPLVMIGSLNLELLLVTTSSECYRFRAYL
uniref:Glucose-6-phosphate isomerase n=1 Tax=Solanum tuberosum TaxID=4113 RepID=M1CYG9_SOLTU